MGILREAEGRSAEAERYHREALQGRLSVLGDCHPDTLVSMNNLGFILHDQRRLSEAEPYYREALAKRRLILGDEHPKTLNSMNNMAGLLKDQGRLTDAEPLYREALAGRRRVLGDDHPETLSSIHNLAWLLEGMGNFTEAEQRYREALDGFRLALGDDHHDTLVSVGNLSALLLAQNRPDEALSLLAPAEPALRRVFIGDRKLRLGKALTVLGRCRTAASDFVTAESNLLEAHDILSTIPNATREHLITVLTALVALYDAWSSSEPTALRATAAASWRAKLEEARTRKP